MSAISITAPKNYQVTQRTAATTEVTIAGVYTYATAGHIEARWGSSGAYTRIATISGGTSQSYSGSLMLPDGQRALTVRIEEEPATAASLSVLSVGELFAVAGQSNAQGRFTNHQSYSSSDGFVASMYFGPSWGELADPFDGGWGHWALPLATALMDALHVPVGFMPGPCSGGVFWSAWQKGQELYDTCEGRISALGSVPRLLLWWEGESDAAFENTTEGAQPLVQAAVEDMFDDTGVTSMLVGLPIATGTPDARTQEIREAIDNVVAANEFAVAGPDFSDLETDDDYHFTTDENAVMVAGRFSEVILAHIASLTVGTSVAWRSV